MQGRPAITYDDQGLVFAIAFGGHIRMFDARKYEKVHTSYKITLGFICSADGLFVSFRKKRHVMSCEL